MDSKRFSIVSELSSLRPRRDGGWSLSFSTLIPDMGQKAAMLDLHMQHGVLVFFGKEKLTQDDEKYLEYVNAVDADLSSPRKTPSSRLRGVLYLLHLQEGGSKETFKDYYAAKMESIIDHFKSKLEE